MTDNDQAARRIMNQFGESSRIPILNITEGDIWVLFGFPLAGLFLASALDQSWLVFPLLVVGLAIGTACVYAAPEHLTSWTWLTNLLRHLVARPRVTYSEPVDGSTTEGGLVDYGPFTPDERTQDLTNVERAWPGAGAVQRPDGTMEAFVELHPDNMDFAMSDDWAAVQRAAQQFANTELEYKLTVHATTRSFPVRQLVDQLENRLTDEDAQQNPTFRALLEEYRDRRPEDLEDARQMRYYLGVEVTPFDVHSRYGREKTAGERLAEFPILGIFMTPFVTRETFGDAERRMRMFDALDARIQAVQSEFTESVPGWSATRLGTLELFVLNMDFWNGEEHDTQTAESLLRTRSVSGRPPNGGEE